MCEPSQNLTPGSAKDPQGAVLGALHLGMRAMYFYPITGVGVLQPGQVAAGWAVAGVLLGLMALG